MNEVSIIINGEKYDRKIDYMLARAYNAYLCSILLQQSNDKTKMLREQHFWCV